jgi:hypothetical protein
MLVYNWSVSPYSLRLDNKNIYQENYSRFLVVSRSKCFLHNLIGLENSLLQKLKGLSEQNFIYPHNLTSSKYQEGEEF